MNYDAQIGFGDIGSSEKQGWNLPYPSQSSAPPYLSNPPDPHQTSPAYPSYPVPPAYPSQPSHPYSPDATYPYPQAHYPTNVSYSAPYQPNQSFQPSTSEKQPNFPYHPYNSTPQQTNMQSNNHNPYNPPHYQPSQPDSQRGSIEFQQSPQTYSQKPPEDSTSSAFKYPSLEHLSITSSSGSAAGKWDGVDNSRDFSRSSFNFKSNEPNNRSFSQKSSSNIETPLPPNTVLLWESHGPVRLFFIQENGHIVSPAGEWKMLVHKMPEMNESLIQGSPKGSLAGNCQGASYLITIGPIWRLGLQKERDFSAKGLHSEFAFYDKSTSPERSAVIHFTKDIKKEEVQRLEVLLRAATHLIDEPSNTVDSVDTGVQSAYNSVTGSMNTFVKGSAPSVHKNTKWIRKGSGTVVRYGGGLMSKSVHFVSDPFLKKDTDQVASNEHLKLFACLEQVRRGINSDVITYVNNNDNS